MPPLDAAAWRDELELPLPSGKTYLVPAPAGHDGLKLQRLFWAGQTLKAGRDLTSADEELLASVADETQLHRLALGPVYEEMLDDGVTLPHLRHAAMTAFYCWAAGKTEATTFWASRGAEAPQRQTSGPAGGNRQQRRAAGKRERKAPTA